MSMRSDMLPQSYCDELVKLRADVKPIDFSEVVALIEQEYGVPIKEVFPIIEEKPLGSASIAQVHIVTLKNGQKAVAKVQRPGIKEIMAQDIVLMRKSAKLLQVIEGPSDVIDFNKIIEELWIVSQQEMDFLLEAGNCKELTELNSGIEYIAFPKVESRLTTSKILVMEYIEGIQIDQVSKLSENGYDMHEIGMKLAKNYVKQVIDDGFFHADPHPGNIWIREGEIVWLDLGMVGKLNHRDRMNIKKIVFAIVNGDIYELKSAILSLGEVRKNINHPLLYADLEELQSRYGSMDLGSMNLGELVQVIIDMCNRHGISIPASITILGRGVMTIEGVLETCCPDVNFIQIISSHMSEEMFQYFDITKELKKSGKLLSQSARKVMELPSNLSDLVKIAVKGQTKVNLDVTGAEEPIRQIGKMVDKLIICIISAALLIRSSLISTTNMKPQVLDIPLFGIVGFFGSTILSGWLLYNIIRNSRRQK